MLNGRDVTLFKKIDDALKTFKTREEEDGDVVIGKNIYVAVSQALYYAWAKSQSMTTPFLEIFKYNVCRDIRPETDRIPKLMFEVLKGGKELGSKVKFSRFYLIINVAVQDADQVDVHEIYFKIN
jgi:enolase